MKAILVVIAALSCAKPQVSVELDSGAADAGHKFAVTPPPAPVPVSPRTCLDAESSRLASCFNCSPDECLALARDAGRPPAPGEAEMVKRLRQAWQDAMSRSPAPKGGVKCCKGTDPCWVASTPEECLSKANREGRE